MNTTIADVLITGYEHLIADLQLPDPDDRHVLAAAVHAQAHVVVTKNLKDFPPAVLAAHHITAEHPDTFLLRLTRHHPDRVAAIVDQIAAT